VIFTPLGCTKFRCDPLPPRSWNPCFSKSAMSCRTLRGTSTLASKNQLQSNAKLPKQFVSASAEVTAHRAVATETKRRALLQVGAVDSFAPAHSASGLPVYVAASRLAPFTRTPKAFGVMLNRGNRISETEGKAAMGSAEQGGSRASFNRAEGSAR
jgi:hypothetical protein